MEDLKNFEVTENDVAAAAGGQTGNPQGAHWQAVNVAMGEPFLMHSSMGNQLWYRIKSGDTLGAICARFGVSVHDVMVRNPNTIQDSSDIKAGDALFLRLAVAAEENYGFYRF